MATGKGRGPRLERALERNGVAHDVKAYPDAGHAFLNDHSDDAVPFTFGTRMAAAGAPMRFIQEWMGCCDYRPRQSPSPRPRRRGSRGVAGRLGSGRKAMSAPTKTWLLLATAIVSEVGGTTALKLADGFTKPLPSLAVAVGYGAAFFLLAQVLKSMSVGVVYAIWAGVGTALVAIVSFIFLGETIEWPAWIGIALIVAGVVLVEAYSLAAEETAGS